MRRTVLAALALAFVLPLAAGKEATDPEGDTRFLAFGVETPAAVCTSDAADILTVALEAADGVLRGAIQVVDARGDLDCGGLRVNATHAARFLGWGVYGGTIDAVTLGAWEHRHASGAVYAGSCARIAFAGGSWGDVAGFPCAPTAPGLAADEWSIPLVGEVVTSDGGTRLYDLSRAPVEHIQAVTGVADGRFQVYDLA